MSMNSYRETLAEYFDELNSADKLAGLGDVYGGVYNYTHAQVPYMGKAIPRSQIKSIYDARVYAAAGFHVCVDQANREQPTSNHYRAWMGAADDYYRVYKLTFGDTPLSQLLQKLANADTNAANAPRVTRDQPPKDPEKPSTPAPVNPSSSVPVPEQIKSTDPYGDVFLFGMSFYTVAVLGAGVILFLKLSEKGRKKRRR